MSLFVPLCLCGSPLQSLSISVAARLRYVIRIPSINPESDKSQDFLPQGTLPSRNPAYPNKEEIVIILPRSPSLSRQYATALLSLFGFGECSSGPGCMG
uniref:Uncharacterized protein n=2 Tax=Candidatus Kentrum sp. FM TaxID=2126340 RepID=A0A450TQE2_9GAMM|nr:MAG: hypothetical protein BECKFM1743C_GA0114222_105512 [Candidatus Kentron sp. FM]VFJ70973.1 MAG: hypothetical protein BECKFM1743A_GA0114220_105692 [Candidatus Kentron sp. FM]